MKKVPFFQDKQLSLSASHGLYSLLAVLLYVAILLVGTLVVSAFH